MIAFRLGLAAATLAAVAACTKAPVMAASPAPSQSGEVPCAPVIGSLSPSTHMDAVAGDYRLTLVATAGPRAGQSVSGSLKIDKPQMATNLDSLPGKSSIALDAVGATAPGPRGGGEVVVREWMLSSGGSMTQQITITFGRVVAPPGTRAIEGAHMALSVKSVSSDGFQGTWTSGSGDPSAPDASGHFCAKRV